MEKIYRKIESLQAKIDQLEKQNNGFERELVEKKSILKAFLLEHEIYGKVPNEREEASHVRVIERIDNRISTNSSMICGLRAEIAAHKKRLPKNSQSSLAQCQGNVERKPHI